MYVTRAKSGSEGSVGSPLTGQDLLVGGAAAACIVGAAAGIAGGTVGAAVVVDSAGFGGDGSSQPVSKPSPTANIAATMVWMCIDFLMVFFMF